MPLRHFVVSLFVLTCAGVLVSGCASPPAKPLVVEPQTAIQAAPTPPAKQQPKPVVSTKPQAPPVQEPATIVLLASGNSDRFTSLAEVLQEKIDQPVVRADFPLAPTEVFPADAIYVAIGDQAAGYLVRRNLGNHSIFTLVFDAETQKLLENGFAGISPYPPPAETLNILQKLDPETAVIILPYSAASSASASHIALVADEAGLRINSRLISTDKELSFLARDLPARETVFWILPDNSILSRQAIFDTMSANLKKSRRTIVFDPALFKLGGLLSSRYSDEAVADATLSLIHRINKGEAVSGVYLQPDTGDIQINSKQAATLGLAIPEELQSLTAPGPR